MTRLLPLDELNNLHTRLIRVPIDPQTGKPMFKREDIIDEMLDLYLLAYYNGIEDSCEMLNLSEKQHDAVYKRMTESECIEETLYKKVADENFIDRVDRYVQDGTAEEIFRVADTDTHRIYNESARRTADFSGVPYTKTWRTMRDERVRDTHDPLEGVTLYGDEEFYTFDGDSASAPGEFSLPENNVNCRCWLEYKQI